MFLIISPEVFLFQDIIRLLLQQNHQQPQLDIAVELTTCESQPALLISAPTRNAYVWVCVAGNFGECVALVFANGENTYHPTDQPDGLGMQRQPHPKSTKKTRIPLLRSKEQAVEFILDFLEKDKFPYQTMDYLPKE